MAFVNSYLRIKFQHEFLIQIKNCLFYGTLANLGHKIEPFIAHGPHIQYLDGGRKICEY